LRIREYACINGAEELHMPSVRIILSRNCRRGIDAWDVTDRNQQRHPAVTSLLLPALLKIEEHVPCNRALNPAMDVMPWLSRSTFLNAGIWEVRLVKILVVDTIQCPEERVMLVVIATITKINTTNKAQNPPLSRAGPRYSCIHYDGFLVVSEHGTNGHALDNAETVIWVSGA
jgi:hypothetical protein